MVSLYTLYLLHVNIFNIVSMQRIVWYSNSLFPRYSVDQIIILEIGDDVDVLRNKL